MKKVLVLFFIVLSISPGLFAEEDEPMRIGAGIGMSMGFFDTSDIPEEYQDAASFLLSLFSLRTGAYGDFSYFFRPSVAAGTEIGFYYLSMDGDYAFTAVDLPMRAYLRFGQGKTYLQGFGGYHLSLGDFSGMTGPEAGAKLSLGGMNFIGSYIAGDIPFVRVELGFSFTNLLQF